MSSLRPDNKTTNATITNPTRDDLQAARFESILKEEIKPLKWEINERINRLDSQEKDDEPAKRDMFGKSAWDYSMIKYKITLGELKDDLIGQRKLLGQVFNGLGHSILDEKDEVERYKRIKAAVEQPTTTTTTTTTEPKTEPAQPAQSAEVIIKPSEVIHSDGKQEQEYKQKTSETKQSKESRQKVSS